MNISNEWYEKLNEITLDYQRKLNETFRKLMSKVHLCNKCTTLIFRNAKQNVLMLRQTFLFLVI